MTEALAPASPPLDRKMAVQATVLPAKALGGGWNAAALAQLGELQR